MINIKKPSPESIREAAQILKNGGVVVVPTDTNYNVVTSPFSKEGVNRIFGMKKRENLSPLTLFLGDSMEMQEYAYTTPMAEFLAKKLWPEKISFILFQKNTVPHYVTRGFGTVAVTLHQHPVLREIAHLLGTPLAGTSANLSGTGNVPNVLKAVEHIGEEVDLIIDDGISPVDGANTIIDLSFNPPVLARDGAYPVASVIKWVPNLIVDINSKQYKDMAKARVVTVIE